MDVLFWAFVRKDNFYKILDNFYQGFYYYIIEISRKGIKVSYVTGTLSADEEIREVIKLHWFNYILTGLLGLMAFLLVLLYFINLALDSFGNSPMPALLFVIWTGYDFLRLYTTEMVITNKRVICKKGIISVKTEELKNSKIESVEIKQSISGRIFGYATIKLSGTGTSKVVFKTIDDPWGVKSKIETIIGD